MTVRKTKKINLHELEMLFQRLRQLEYDILGPVLRNAAIVYDRIESVADLPKGVRDEQEAGHYRLQSTGDDRLFAYVVGPESWKKYLFPSEEIIYTSQKNNEDLIFTTAEAAPGKRAFFGIRPCELHGIAVQDRVFLEGSYSDSGYASRRDQLLFIAVNCTRSAATCFCTSVDTGPAAKAGFDLALTEVYLDEHYFVLDIGSELGEEIVSTLNFADASQAELNVARAGIDNAAQQQRKLNTVGLKERIYNNLENQAFWDDIATRCLSCANCTLVCPTCFCSSVEEDTDLRGDTNQRVKHWDSCFNLSHSHIAGGSVRETGFSRYRQWFNHKLASWQDQFDTLGCVGCGRCITWCPVGIDITAEVARLEKSGNS